MEQSLTRQRRVSFKGWKDEYPFGCKPHSEEPYAFKRAALLWARDHGYDIAIWADSSCWFIKDPTPIVNEIARDGYWLCTLGWNVGQWCSDRALPGTGKDREQLFDIPMVAATFYGIDLRKEISRRYFEYMGRKQQYFAGPYNNKQAEASKDCRVLGHRHDQTFLSLFAHENSLNINWPPCYLDYAVTKKVKGQKVPLATHNKAIVLAQGM